MARGLGPVAAERAEGDLTMERHHAPCGANTQQHVAQSMTNCV
jgi:hypothetical protein